MRKTSAFLRGFTLIELLVVISIIAILAGMTIPTFYYAKQRAREAEARVTVKQLETAFRAYLDTYKVWPDAWPGAYGAPGGPNDIKGDIFKTLRGENISDMNKQEIVFYEFESYTNFTDQTTAYDPWSNPKEDPSTWQAYQVMFDKDYDNKISLPGELGGGDAYRSVAVWSVGNRDETNIIASWK